MAVSTRIDHGLVGILVNILNKMLARAGKTVEDLNPISRVGKILRRNGVRDSNELDRILRLPRRKWEDAPNLTAMASDLQVWLRTHWAP